MRDEVGLKIHLGAKDVQDEWHEIERKWKKFSDDADVKLKQFSDDAELAESGQDVMSALDLLGSELKTAYQRIRKAL